MSVRRLAVLTASGALVVGMTVGATGPAQAGDAGRAAGQTVQVLVRGNHTVAMPDRIRPGVTKFVVSSRRAAGFQLAQAAPGYTKREAARDINAAFGKNNMRALRRFERNMRLLGGMPSKPGEKARMWVRLQRGTYWALDSNPRVLRPKKIKTFHVTGRPVGGLLPGKRIAATGEASFAATPKRIARKGVLRFVNRSDVPHFIELVKLAPGKTVADFREWIDNAKQGAQAPPPVMMNTSASTGVISGGERMSFRYRLPRGRYVLTCWWPMSDMGGAPHAFMGMYRGIRVG